MAPSFAIRRSVITAAPGRAAKASSVRNVVVERRSPELRVGPDLVRGALSRHMTSLLHTFPKASAFAHRIQRTEFDALPSFEELRTVGAENHTALMN